LNSHSLSPNHLLASLLPGDFELIRPRLRTHDLRHQAVLVEAGASLAHIYFPHSGIISLVTRLVEGISAVSREHQDRPGFHDIRTYPASIR
jgi:hypothetical protein